MYAAAVSIESLCNLGNLGSCELKLFRFSWRTAQSLPIIGPAKVVSLRIGCALGG